MIPKSGLRRFLSILLILFTTFLVTACNSNEESPGPLEEEKSEILQSGSITVQEVKADLPQSDLTYPQVTGFSDQALEERINKILKNEAFSYREKTLKEATELELDGEKMSFYGDFEVAYNQSGLLSIAMPQGSYFEGAAHPNNYLSAITVDVKEGKIVYLPELFTEKTDLKALLDPLMEAQIKARNLTLLADFAGLEEAQEYYLGPAHLIIYYQTYAYTPHAYGPLKLAIPYQQVAEHLDPRWGLLERATNMPTDEEVRNLLLEAHKKYLYLARGGAVTGDFENFTYEGMDYRYLQGDIATRQGLLAYLSPIFTATAIEQSLQNMAIIEHEGRMAQPNADGGSMLNWEKLTLQLIDEGEKKRVYEIFIPHDTSPDDSETWRCVIVQDQDGTWKTIETVDSFM
ncbi:DUF4163 domain-containing protein [Heliorestis acidaminivorans]|uniref:DUF4163 domain-containing protein n=1 Tax=Heliorestis acidaminivorans TaxID=553427 RepID=A0A6I0F480_9FIRM|nr:DL-endopeptidase inhibitor IseA family protein [Heliorestis acidaminivorans]KAB2953382.1 DUF4163 domain-containing protein [Heliorestis acidaminivorans]